MTTPLSAVPVDGSIQSAMTAQEYKQLADVLGQILNGNAVGFFVLVAIVVFLAYAVVSLYRQNVAALKECHDERQDCHRNMALLTEAQLRAVAGHMHESKVLAEMVQVNLSGRGQAGSPTGGDKVSSGPRT